MRIVTHIPLLPEPRRDPIAGPLAPILIVESREHVAEVEYDETIMARVAARIAELGSFGRRRPFALVCGWRAYWSIVAHLVSAGADPRPDPDDLVVDSHAVLDRGTFTLPALVDLGVVPFCLLTALEDDAVEFATRP